MASASAEARPAAEADARAEDGAGGGPWSRAPEALTAELSVELEQGLSEEEVARRREEHGPNRLQTTSCRSAWAILVGQLKSIIVVLLVAAAGIALVFGRFIESAAILVVIVLNTAIGFVGEWRAPAREVQREVPT